MAVPATIGGNSLEGTQQVNWGRGPGGTGRQQPKVTQPVLDLTPLGFSPATPPRVMAQRLLTCALDSHAEVGGRASDCCYQGFAQG